MILLSSFLKLRYIVVSYWSYFSYTGSPWLKMVRLYNGVKVICIQYKLYFKFWSFPGLVICTTILSPNAGERQWAAAASQSQGYESKQQIHLQPFFTHTTIPFFTFSRVSISYMRDTTFYYKAGFVLDHFAQLQVNISALSTFKSRLG